MSQENIDILLRTLEREKAARKAAEKILESKSLELYLLSEELKNSNTKLETLLDEKLSQLEGIFENIVDAYVVIDLEGNVMKFNDAASELFGYDINKEPLNVMNLVYKDDVTYALSSFSNLQEKGFFKDYEARIYTKSHKVKWVHINASVVYDKSKKPIAAQGIVRDITESKISDKKLKESENRLATLIQNLDSAILLEDEHRKLVLTNHKFCEFFKIPVSPELLIGQDCSNPANESKLMFDNPDEFVTRIEAILANKTMVLGDEITMVDGTILERDFIPIKNGDEYKGHLWTYKNVTLSRTYRKSLEAQKQKYSSIIANMNLGLLEVNNNDEILLVNQSFCEMSGYKEEELIGKKGSEILLLENQSEIIEKENIKRLKGESNSYELKVKNKANEDRIWLVSGAPNYDLSGKIVGSIGIHLDVTDFKALEKQKELILDELEKRNEELHEYAHIVSHDLKSPLRNIDALVSWIKEDNKNKLDAITHQNLELIEKTLENMENLISNILAYSSSGTSQDNDELVALDEIVHNIIKVNLIPENISISILNKLPMIYGDATKFQQLFQNLISNAIKFSDKENGIVEVDYIETETHYQFSVKDNGIGIEKKYHEKIFKIFQSLTKREDSTGIGLSITKKIVELYHGKIWLDSQQGIGTTFYFTIEKKI
ncbi:MAG: PAS domain S-box protein [Polaribacter sp.]|nr:PAS domain S-box protein [Polaribacter sp.]